MSNIKIAVACHKPSELPKNSLFLPIQVGAALSNTDLGLQKDNEGDNISDKNPEYCELTAEYWLWKNVEADYYGLCHYRRFICFRDVDAKKNLRSQIEASVINQFNIERFGLEDEAAMRQIIESHDVVTGELQSVRKLYTPTGNKLTAYEHWAAHDRALIMKHDLDKMLEILCEVSPELGADAREYLAGSEFLGFNCFVMKKEFFNELCTIEFEVLSRLEKVVDLSSYCQQLTRIYGFMAEIISSAYIYHLEKTGHLVKHLPLVYFNYTDPIKEIEPASSERPTIPILFNLADNNPALFGTIWKSFLAFMDDEYFYDIILFAESLSSTLLGNFERMADGHENLSLRILDAKPYRELYSEKYHLKDKRKHEEGDERQFFSVLPFVPYILPKYNRLLIFDENIIFCDSISKLWQEHCHDESLISAPNHPLMQAKINDRYYTTAEAYVSTFLDVPQDYFSINAAIVNLEKIRTEISEAQIADAFLIPNNNHSVRHREDVFNLLCQYDVTKLDQRWNTWLESSNYLKEQLPYLPFARYKELLNARKHPGIVSYMEDDPFLQEVNDLHELYWEVARSTVFYTTYLQRSYHIQAKLRRRAKKNITAKVFPVDGGLRGRLNRIFPRGSKRYATIKKIMNKVGIS